MRTSLIRKITQIPFVPNRIVKWIKPNLKTIIFPNKVTVIDINVIGVKYKLEIRNYNCYIQRHIYLRGFYELRETKIIKEILSSGDIFVDIGANIGWYTVLASKIVGLKGRVFSFEPSTEIFNHLEKNIAINKLENVTTSKTALSNQTGEAYFNIAPKNNEGIGSLISNVDVDYQQDVVKTIEFDNYFEREKIRLVKIDVEGAEFKVLQSMKKTLRQKSIDYIMFEVNDSFLERAEISRDELFNLFTKNNYDLYHIKYLPLNTFCIEPLRQDQERFLGDNILAKLAL